MTMFDKIKDVAKSTTDKVDEMNKHHQLKKEAEYEANKDNPEWLFKSTTSVGDLEIDTINKLFRIKNAKSEYIRPKKKGLISKTANVAMFAGTFGMSSVAKGIKKMARKPDSVYHFNELVEFELLEDDSHVTSGGLGRSLVGAVTFGPAGAIVGSVTGKKKTKKTIESLLIRVTVNDIDNPIIILPIITKKTKTSSKEYNRAFNLSQKIVSTLNVIANNKEEVIQKVEEINDDSSIVENDLYEEVKKLKELLDLDIISEEEFEIKKKEILGL